MSLVQGDQLLAPLQRTLHAPGGLADEGVGPFGFFLFVYALTLAAAAALSVFGLSEGMEEYMKHSADQVRKSRRDDAPS